MQLNGYLSYLIYAASIVYAAPTAKRASGSTGYSGGSTANDIKDGVCAPVTLIFARGSTETGNMGNSVGPALAKSLIKSLNGNVAIQGVDYTASIASNAELGAGGGPVMAQLAKTALQQCPSTKIAISGYSQGGEVCHYAVKNSGLSADDVAAAVIYGDPEDGSAVGDLPSSRLKEFCATGDGVCETHTFAITAAHLSYTTGQDIPEGAQFIIQNTGASSTTGTSSTGTTSSSGSDTTESSSSSSGLGSLGGLGGSSSSGLGSLGGLGGSSSGSSGLGSLGGSSSSGLGSLGSLGGSSSGSSGLGSLGGLSGSGTSSSGLGSLGSLGGSSSSSGLGSLSSLGGSSGGFGGLVRRLFQ